MKKLAIAILLILMIVLLFLQYLYKKENVKNIPTVEKKTENVQEGVPLPPEASDLSKVNITSASPSRAKQTTTIDKVDEPVPEHIAGCSHNSIPLILQDYGTIWGDNPKGYVNKRKYVFTSQEVLKIKDLIARYYACRAIVDASDATCSELPHKGDSKSTSMTEYCKDYYTYASFAAFMSGKAKDQFACSNYWNRIKSYTPKELKENVFCKAASNGLPNLCDSMSGQGLDSYKGLCYNVFPKTPDGCVNSPIKNLTSTSSVDCKGLYALYNGINSSDPSACPDAYKEICAALISNTNGECTKIKDKLVITYCDIYKRVQSSEEEYLKKEMEKSKRAEEGKKKKQMIQENEENEQ